ncbi:MAG: hypothetical protein AAFQ27_06480 [Pseudomonadota bacterium]
MLKYSVLFTAIVSSGAIAQAQSIWQSGGGEGSHYAYVTDGGFVESSYQNGIMLFCPDDGRKGRSCELRVKVDGELPRARTAVTFEFSDGLQITRLAESVSGGKPQIGWEWEGQLITALRSQSSVVVSIADGPKHTFTLRGSSGAIRKAMDQKAG